MKGIPLLLLVIHLIPKASFCQIYVEPFTGYQTDINNSKTSLINSGLQLAFKKGKRYEFLLQVQRGSPLQAHFTDAAFTLNPALPLSETAEKTITHSCFSIAAGNRFLVTPCRSKNGLYVKIYTGITDQKTTIGYHYDKNNYVILNPDQTQEHAGIFISGGLEYMRRFEHSRLFTELNFSSPPSGKLDYPSSYNLVAPLSVNIGYSIQISR